MTTGKPMVETRGQQVVKLLEAAAKLCLRASDFMKLTDEDDGTIYAGPKAHQIGAVVDLLYALAAEVDPAHIDGQAAP